MDNNPTYKINGTERRVLKKELSNLRRFVKNFWHFHQIDKDMADFYGSNSWFPMSDEDAKKKFDETNNKIKKLEEELSVLYNN
jgi:hypothetical protein